MKNKIYRWALFFLFFFLPSCRQEPEFINHSRPDLHVDFEIFNKVGCPKNEYGVHACGADSPLTTLGCDEIREPSNLMGGLVPSYPIAFCDVHFGSEPVDENLLNEIESEQYFYTDGGMFINYVRYVIYKDGEFVLVKTVDEFRDIFAPIESPEEALAYVLAVKKLSAYYDLKRNPDYEYSAGTIEDTHITVKADGYRLLLYNYKLFGCGPHWTSAVNLQVSFDGVVRVVDENQVFRDPDEDDLCVD